MIELPWLYQFGDLSLLLMRLLVGAVFISSGWKHAADPVARGKEIEMSPGLTRFIGIAEVAGGLGVALGVIHGAGGADQHDGQDEEHHTQLCPSRRQHAAEQADGLGVSAHLQDAQDA